jgi:hypothetical protein
MLINGRVHKVLNFYDLNSLISFEEWAKNSLTLYADDEKISDNNLKVLLEYVKNQAKENKVDKKIEWFNKIDALIERLDKEQAS